MSSEFSHVIVTFLSFFLTAQAVDQEVDRPERYGLYPFFILFYSKSYLDVIRELV